MIVIQSPRLQLSQFQMKDAQEVFACITPAIARFMPWEPPSWSEYVTRCEQRVQVPEPNKFSFVIRRLDNRECLGMASSEDVDCETMATLIRPNSPTEEVPPVNGKKFTLEEVQRLVGGDVQLLEVTPSIYGEIKVTARDKMFVVREGKQHGLPFNRVATAIYVHSARNRVFGSALITRKGEF